MLVARSEPGDKSQTTDMYMNEAETVEIVNHPYKTCNTDALKNRLNQLAGLPSLDFAGGEVESSFKYRPSIRDMAAFEFQPQHIVANPYTLFFKADTFDHREKLKTIFPFVLGAITNKILALRRELKELVKEFELKTEELNNRKAAANAWIIDIKASYSKAREFGLLREAPNPQTDWDINNYIQILQKVPKSSELNLPKIEEGSTERAVKELNALKNEEEGISHSIGVLRNKLSKLESLSYSEEQYGKALNFQTERLDSVGWFEDKIKDKTLCPFCGSESRSASDEISKLLEVTKNVQRTSQAVTSAREVLDKEIADIKKQLRDLEGRLNVVRDHRQLLESKSEDLRARRQTLNEIYRFVGRLEQSLDNLNIVQIDSRLVEELKLLESRIKDIKVKLNPEEEKRRLGNALNYISSYISHYVKFIDVERPNDPIHLDTTNLTVQVLLKNRSRKDYLWEIGSGANWMGYHISTLLALHEYFLSLNISPVPNFLVIDQPSQVYFPERWPGDLDPKNPSKLPEEPSSDDIERVNKIFRTLSEGLSRTKNKLQLLVIEHADEITWQGIKDINLVDRWRDGRALIPQDW
ncbi:Protein of unknown function (DUF3732) [Candidatus Methanoperedens nitroreducens]|uniref:DUF3732 domain-containing protein n=2 Tax=Candidatus Methanoperedens nitratireducens TaxID=1392998 RepID=A0A062UYL8_9EURY|nr:Protein of unknown function (DUF3732) [Candidatus Methanoperedens nitroreducens]